MNVRCPQCETTFRVDPERIPAAGIKARCSRCSTVFELTRQGAAPARPAPAPAAPPKLTVSAPAAAPAPAPPAATPTPAPAPEAPPTARAATTAVEDPAVTAAVPRPLPPRDLPPPITPPTPAPPAPAPEPSPVKRPSFRNQDPGARAQRLARALVSDIVAYNKDKVQQASSAPALRTEFRDEIRKSWEEYVEQVGLDLAKSTPYFRDALNEILARGEKVF